MSNILETKQEEQKLQVASEPSQSAAEQVVSATEGTPSDGGKEPQPEEKAAEKPEEKAAEEKSGEKPEEKTAEEKIEERPKKKKTVLIIILCVIAVLLVALGVTYYKVSEHYKTHFLPGTVINQIDCSDLEAAEVSALLEAQPVTCRLEVIGRDQKHIGSLTAEDVGLRIVNTLPDVEAILASQDYYSWPVSVLTKDIVSHEVICVTEFDKEKVLTCVQNWETLDTDRMEAPENAYISEYISEIKGYKIIPETKGDLLDVESVETLIVTAVEDRATKLDLEEEGCYVHAQITADDDALQDILKELNKITGTVITYDWNGSKVVLDGDTIHQWILKEEDWTGMDGKLTGEILLDEEAVAAFVAAQAKKYDTYGKNRTFTTALGETIPMPNGGYGWLTDRDAETEELVALIKEGAVEEREPVYRVTAMKKGTDDIGNSYVEIDLTHQHLYLFWKGNIVLETDFVSGDMAKGNVTPGGLYRLTYRATDAVLRGRDYVTPVKYWMPFNGNIGMHDATWRTEFGGDIYLTDGSHGCVNLPLDKAGEIFGYIRTGFPIICYYY